MPLWVDPGVPGAECRRFDSYVVKGPTTVDWDFLPVRSERATTEGIAWLMYCPLSPARSSGLPTCRPVTSGQEFHSYRYAEVWPTCRNTVYRVRRSRMT